MVFFGNLIYSIAISYFFGKLPILGYPLLDGRQSAPV